MPRLAGLVAAVATLALLAPGAADGREPVVGIGDQKADMFGDRRLDWLDIRHARIVVPWYLEVHGSPRARAQVRDWLAQARQRGIEPLVGFDHGYVRPWRGRVPSLYSFRRGLAAFRRAYPWVRDYLAWNEANRCVRARCATPVQVAGYFDAINDSCARCRVVAGAFVTAPNLDHWVRAFRRAALYRPTLWGLHNHGDINRFQWWRTRRFLKLVRGRVWITEAGGLVSWDKDPFEQRFEMSDRRAGQVTSYLLRQARRSRPRIERVYLYHWNTTSPAPGWDSGIIDARGEPRPAFGAVARHLGRDPRRAPGPAGWRPAAPQWLRSASMSSPLSIFERPSMPISAARSRSSSTLRSS